MVSPDNNSRNHYHNSDSKADIRNGRFASPRNGSNSKSGKGSNSNRKIAMKKPSQRMLKLQSDIRETYTPWAIDK